MVFYVNVLLEFDMVVSFSSRQRVTATCLESLVVGPVYPSRGGSMILLQHVISEKRSVLIEYGGKHSCLPSLETSTGRADRNVCPRFPARLDIKGRAR